LRVPRLDRGGAEGQRGLDMGLDHPGLERQQHRSTEGAIAIAEALKVNAVLTKLNLEYNSINSMGEMHKGKKQCETR
jgi:hypothetical protein